MRVVERPFSEFLRQPNDVVAEREDHDVVLRQPAALDAAVDEVFAWVVFLPGADRALFVDELVRTLVAAAEVENLAPVAQLLREWRATAEIHADPALARRLSGPITTSGGSITVPAG